jgi:hypothetical protein
MIGIGTPIAHISIERMSTSSCLRTATVEIGGRSHAIALPAGSAGSATRRLEFTAQ